MIFPIISAAPYFIQLSNLTSERSPKHFKGMKYNGYKYLLAHITIYYLKARAMSQVEQLNVIDRKAFSTI